ncbi:MAG TPA: TonB-dependent receptor [Xanthomonadales bacterium]|nr:TonB-dependent receptor [Xanthomonadales bacterium]
MKDQIKGTDDGVIFLLKPLLSALSLSILMSGAAFAAVLEEITITAQKREQSLQDVGISVTAFTGDQLRDLGIEESQEVAMFTPGVHIGGSMAGQNSQFTIRGVSQNDYNDIVEAPNAVYVDEGYMAFAQGQTFALYDIERVEILKGPQGTLFGRNATGGLIHYITRKPTFENDGFFSATYGQFDTPADADQYTLEGAIGGAMTDTLAGRVAFRYNNQDGYLKNIYPFAEVGAATFGASSSNSPGPGAGADLGTDDTYGARGSLLFEPRDDMRLSFSLNSAHSNVSTSPYQSKATIGVLDADGELINVIDAAADETRASIAADGSDGGSDQGNSGSMGPPFGRPVPGGDFFGYVDPDGDDFTFSGDFAFHEQGDIDTLGVNARYEWDISAAMQLVAISDFKDFEKQMFLDVDAAPVNQLVNYQGADATTFTQELRLSGDTDRTRWVAGFYYLNIDNHSDNGLKAPANSLPALFGFGMTEPGIDIGVVADMETDSYSLFGQLEYDLTEQWTLITGLRLIREEKDFVMDQPFSLSTGTDQINNGFVLFSARPAPFVDDTSDDLWAGKVQLDWRPSDDLLLYAGLNRGIKAGSFNAPIPGGLPFPDSTIPYDEEVLTSFETGFKSTIMDGLGRFNGTAFYYDYKDYQAFLFTGVSGVVVNADAETMGVELELQLSPGEGWDILLSAAYLDATVKDVPFRIGSPLPPEDRDPTYSPELQAAALVRYQWPALGGTMAVQGDMTYSDEFFYNLRNFDADQFDSYVLMGARLSWYSGNEAWETSLILNNLTDERAGTIGFDLATLCGCNEVSYVEPRWYGVSVRYNFF